MRRAHLVGADLLEQLAAAVEHADVRPEELVGGAGNEVTANGVQVDRAVGSELDGVHVADRSRLACQPRHRLDV